MSSVYAGCYDDLDKQDLIDPAKMIEQVDDSSDFLVITCFAAANTKI